MKIFLSYASSDHDWAIWIGVTLRDAGHEMYLHEWEAAPFGRIPDSMEKRLEQADRIVGVFSPTYVVAIQERLMLPGIRWLYPADRDERLVPVEVKPPDEWPPFAGHLRRLSLVGLTEVEATAALLTRFGTATAVTDPPRSLGDTRTRAEPSSEPGAPDLDFMDGAELPTAPPTFPPSRYDRLDRPASDIGDGKRLRAWLDNRSIDIHHVTAMRAALRVVPLLGGLRLRTGAKRRLSDILLPMFRVSASRWAVVRYSTNYRIFLAADAAASNAIGPATAYAACDADSTANSVAAKSAVSAVHARSAYVGVDFASEAVAKLDRGAVEIFWGLLSLDAAALDGPLSPEDLAGEPLWAGGFPNPFGEQWVEFARGLLAKGEGWDVWIAWYEDRVYGRPADEEKEIARLTVPEELWQDPAKANAEIKRRFDEIDARRSSMATAGRAPSAQELKPGVALTPATVTPLVFVSYAHKDRSWLEELQSHLGPYFRQGSLQLWDDTRLLGSDQWEAEIAAAMQGCRICILLVSRHSLTSDYIDRVEMRTILERVRSDGIRIFPIVITPVSIPAEHWLRKFNWRPADGRTLQEFAPENGLRDREFVNIVEEIILLLGSLSKD